MDDKNLYKLKRPSDKDYLFIKFINDKLYKDLLKKIEGLKTYTVDKKDIKYLNNIYKCEICRSDFCRKDNINYGESGRYLDYEEIIEKYSKKNLTVRLCGSCKYHLDNNNLYELGGNVRSNFYQYAKKYVYENMLDSVRSSLSYVIKEVGSELALQLIEYGNDALIQRYYIYEIYNSKDDTYYIGQTSRQPCNRWQDHINTWIENEGLLNHVTFKILEQGKMIKLKEILIREQYWINCYIKEGKTLRNKQISNNIDFETGDRFKNNIKNNISKINYNDIVEQYKKNIG